MIKQMDFKTQTRIKIVAKTVAGLCAVVFTLLGFGVWSLVFLYLINQTAMSIQFWIHSRWYPGFVFNFEKFKYHFKFGYKARIPTGVNPELNGHGTLIDQI